MEVSVKAGYMSSGMSCGGCFFFFQAEDGIRDLVRSRGLGDVYKRQLLDRPSRGLFTRLVRLKREVILLRKTLIYEREILSLIHI